MNSLADQIKKQSKRPPSTSKEEAAELDRGDGPAAADGYRPSVKKLSAELPADEFKWVRVTAAEHDTNATAIVRGLLLLARKDPKVLRSALETMRT